MGFQENDVSLQIETERRRKMKRILYILVCLLAVGMTQAVPVPDSFLPQRTETATGPIAQGSEGRIVFTAGSTFNVYSSSGQLVKVVRVSADQRGSVEFPNGFYIVRCGNQWSRKVVVR